MDPQLLVNDYTNGKKVLTTILQELTECKAFYFGVAFVTKSGVAVLINTLKELEERKIRGKILVSQYQNFTEPEALRTLLRLPNVELRIAVAGNFHAKGYLFQKSDGYSLVIGSSNMTDKALCANKEWNLKLLAAADSPIITSTLAEFDNEFDAAERVDSTFIAAYESLYTAQKAQFVAKELILRIVPNTMQTEALGNLQQLRAEGKNRALLISATATGKTFLSAFDVKNVDAKRCLFVVHRANIAQKAMESYRKIFGRSKVLGMYSGEKREISADFLFSTIQTISRDQHLSQFDRAHFDYIVIDETHRAGAESYQKIINYFQPAFLLGMTATPERTDGFDIFKQFNYDIAYEIRLQKALEEDMLCTFHYYGITDDMVSDKRVDTIIEKATLYGCDNGCVRGLIFCSTVMEAKDLSTQFNDRGYKTVSICGDDSPATRAEAIQQLEDNNEAAKLDYIFTVDVFNEGIDIPKVNQIILLRPTQSAIVFVQQLGRGLRKADDKAYLTVIDFIGNYSNNYMIPIALFGDTSYSKDTLRKLMASGSSLIPGASTVNFDRIAQRRIFESIDSANLSLRKDLAQDYQLLKFKIGRMPMMVDFIEHGSRDPFLYVKYAKSYFNFAAQEESSLQSKLSPVEIKLIELFSNHVADAQRIEEVMILKALLLKGSIGHIEAEQMVYNKFGFHPGKGTIESCIRTINFEFIKTPQKIIVFDGVTIQFHADFLRLLQNSFFKLLFEDVLAYAEMMYNRSFDLKKFVDGFLLYQKYSRKDVCRILNWDNDEQSTMYGYKVKNATCPIFVNYHKEEGIASTTKYQDRFVSRHEFEWMSRAKRTLDSKEIIAIKNYQASGGHPGLRLPLFVKKNNDEGTDFYYMGDVTPTAFEQTTLTTDKQKPLSIVRVNFSMNHPVEESIYHYLVTT
jgi:superfamily II DNA or RNA helicase